jgi:hypothetical protein
MRIIKEPKELALWNKRHFEEKKNWVCAACLKNFVRKFVEKIYKTGFLEGSGVPVLYIGLTVPKGLWQFIGPNDSQTLGLHCSSICRKKIYITAKVKVKITISQPMKAQRGAFFNLSTTWSGWSPHPGHFTLGKNRYLLCRCLGEPPGWSGRVRKISHPHGIRNLDIPACSEYPHRLSYPSPDTK